MLCFPTKLNAMNAFLKLFLDCLACYYIYIKIGDPPHRHQCKVPRPLILQSYHIIGASTVFHRDKYPRVTGIYFSHIFLCPGWVTTVVLPLSTSCIARITGVSHHVRPPILFFKNSFDRMIASSFLSCSSVQVSQPARKWQQSFFNQKYVRISFRTTSNPIHLHEMFTLKKYLLWEGEHCGSQYINDSSIMCLTLLIKFYIFSSYWLHELKSQ
jgi:hypothetical protein